MSAAAVELREIILGGQRIAYTLRRSARKTLGLRIDHRGLTVGVPLRVGLREAEAFIRSHAAWVVEKLHNVDIETLTPLEALNFLYELKNTLDKD